MTRLVSPLLLVCALAVAGCVSEPVVTTAPEESIGEVSEPTVPSTAAAVADDEPVSYAVPPCSDFPDWDWNDTSAEYTEAQLIALTNQVWSVIGPESGLQGAGIGRENRVSLDFVDPPEEGFNDLLAQLPNGYCIEDIAYTPEPPEFLDIIDEYGEVSAMPEGVHRVGIWFAPGNEPTPEDTELTLWVQEQDCASGREMGDRLLGPEVFESESEVLIAFAVVGQLTIQNCPSNPATEVTVTLDQPVGDREIRKGAGDALIKVSNGDI